MMTTETATVVINGIEYELPTTFEFTVCQAITVTLHRPAVVQVEGTIEEIEQEEEGKQ